MFKQNTLAKAIGAAAFGLAAVGAQAAVTAIATDQLTNFTVSVNSGTLSFSNTAPATRTSAASATFNGSGPSNSNVSTPPAGADAAPATAGPGPFPANNTSYNQTSAVPFTGAFGDSQVFGNFLDGGSTVNATAQARLADGVFGTASSQGRVQTAGNILLTLSGTTAATFTISFTDDLNLFAQSTLTGGTALASTTARFRLSDMAGDVTFFDFTPNGVAGGNGANTTETSDPFTLNSEISALGVDTTSVNPGPGFFSAFTTTALAAGTYRLDLLVQKNAAVTQQANPIPEPSSVMLMALGLVAAGAATRRKPRA